MPLANLIKSSVQKARAQLGDLAIQFVVKRKLDSTYYNGRNEVNYREVPLFGAHDKFETHEMDGNIVKVTDDKIMLFIDANDQVPEFEDQIVEGDKVYQVIKSQPIYAGDKVVLAMVHARK